MFAIKSYIDGRSHLFALVLADLMDTNSELAWNKEYINPISGEKEIVLIHAYVPDSNLIVDSTGKRTKKTMLQEFQFESISYEKASVKRIYKLIELGVLDDFEEGEYEALEKYVLENKNTYL